MNDGLKRNDIVFLLDFISLLHLIAPDVFFIWFSLHIFVFLNILQLYTLIVFSIKEKVSCVCKWLQMAVGMYHSTGLFDLHHVSTQMHVYFKTGPQES